MTKLEKILDKIAYGLLIVLTLALVYTQIKLHKAQVCNRAFQLYFYYNAGIVLDMDKFYEDAQKWVNDPQYDAPNVPR